MSKSITHFFEAVQKTYGMCFIGFKTGGVAECFKPAKTHAVRFFKHYVNRRRHRDKSTVQVILQ